ncbi:uncharacterized protein [Venturia canescens]|uniref:uncharacterized protein n=1 Tax=Venturia canescens TaxID=32260 RepID=UPI001C9BE93F|nr:uncharacterized protein LOC122419304 [Venturia canescens]
MKPTDHFFKYLATIYLATSWIGCQAYPEHDRSIITKRETSEADTQVTKELCENVPRESDTTHQVATEKPKDDVEAGEILNDKTPTIQVLERPARDSGHFQHRSSMKRNDDDSTMRKSNGLLSPDSEGPLVGSRAHHKTAAISEMYEQPEQRNFHNDLTRFIQTILDDVNTLMDLAATIFERLKISLIEESRNDCNSCLSLLNANADDYERTESLISKFLVRGPETVDRWVKEPSHRWHGMNDLMRQENMNRNIVACVSRVKRRLFKLLALVRECANLHEDMNTPAVVDAIKDFVSEFDAGKFEILDDITKHRSGYSPRGSTIKDASSGASSSRLSARNYRAAPGAGNKRSYRVYDNEDVADVSGKVTEEIKAFGSLLDFLRGVPAALSEILQLINSGCTSRALGNGNKHNKPASSMYNRNGNHRNSYATAAAHSPSGFIVGNPRSDDSSGPSAASSSAPGHDARRQQHFKTSFNKNSESSTTDDYSDDGWSENSIQSSEPVLGQARNGASNTAAAKNPAFTGFDKPGNTPSENQDPILGKSHRRPFASRLYDGSTTSTGSAPGFSPGSVILPGFLSHPFPQCHYINTIKFEGPVNSYGFPYPSQQFSGLPNLFFGPSTMSSNDFNDEGISALDLPSLNEADRFGISREFILKVPIDQGLMLLGSDPIEFGDYIALDMGKCTLVSKFKEATETMDFQLLGSPLVFFKSNDRSIGSVWEISFEHFADVVGSRTCNVLRKKCDKISHLSAFNDRTNYKRSTPMRD